MIAPDGAAVIDPTAFGCLLRRLRVGAGLSQNRLGRLSGIAPAYTTRLERDDVPHGMPSRAVVLRIWGALLEEEAADATDRERLLVLAGHCPELILALGWDGYVARITAVLNGR